MIDYKDLIKAKGVFIVAELGVNYYDIAEKENISPIDAAKLMIDKAKENGADAIKLQSYKAEKLVIKNSPAYWDLKKEPSSSQYELFKKFDHLDYNDYKELFEYCKSKTIIFLSTPFDFEFVDFLDDFLPIFKISSSDITNIPFIEYIAKKGKPIFLSSGASTLGEIERAINAILSTGNKEICIMHCILDYPTKNGDANLNMIKYLGKVFPDYLIGYSDHTSPDESMLISTIAYVYGAKVIEKHFTLDKKIPGNDHYHAMDPSDLKKLVSNIALINKINGQYQKKPLDCEKNSRIYARRSIIAVKNIKKGEVITKDLLTFKRPGIGIPPFMLNLLIGGVALEDIMENELIKLDKIKLVNNLNKDFN